MSIHLKLFNDAEKHDLIVAAGSEAQKLLTLMEAKYPALVDAFKAAFSEVENDPSVHGFAKMAKVVRDNILPRVPELATELKDFPNLESLLLGFGQKLWLDGIAALEQAAKNLIDKLVK